MESVELETIKEEIRAAKGGMYDPTLTRLPFWCCAPGICEPIGVCCLRDIDRKRQR